MASNPHSRKSPAELAERRIKCYELSLLGMSTREIGEQVGVSHTQVSNDIKAEAESKELPARQAYQQHSLDQIQLAIYRVMTEIQQGVRVARNAEVFAKLKEREARMLGYDSPIQQEIAAIVEHKPTEILDLINRARQQSEEDEARLREGPP
jgi:predicted transcriptional regulator